MRAILFSLIFLAGTAFGQTYGERQITEYPNDTFPTDVWFVGPIQRQPTYIPSDFGGGLYFPTPYYYWWLGLEGAGLQVGADGSVMMLREAVGTVEFTFPGPVEDVRVRLVGFPDLDETVKINGEEVDSDLFVAESTACDYYWNPSVQNKNPCTIYQAIVPGDGSSVLYVETDKASILKISSAPSGTIPEPPAPDPIPDPPPSSGSYFPEAFEDTNDVWNSLPSGKYKVKIEIKDSDGEKVSKETIKIQK
jgi:hypothetical protein